MGRVFTGVPENKFCPDVEKSKAYSETMPHRAVKDCRRLKFEGRAGVVTSTLELWFVGKHRCDIDNFRM